MYRWAECEDGEGGVWGQVYMSDIRYVVEYIICNVLDENHLFSWGSNEYGQLGLDSQDII